MTTAGPLAIVTRPAPDAQMWVEGLAGRGLRAVALPLIDIRPARDSAGLASAWARIDSCQVLMFVSAHAVAHFFAARPEGSQGHPTWRAWATGPGTVKALVRVGIDPAIIDAPDTDAAQWDSEALWQRVRGSLAAVRRVLIVRGSGADGRMAGRDWLAQQLQAEGVEVQFAVAYERHLPVWITPEHDQLFSAVSSEFSKEIGAANDSPVWIFSSSEAIANLTQLMPGQHWAQARAVATHARIALAARNAGFGVVCESRPGLDAVSASIKSLQ